MVQLKKTPFRISNRKYLSWIEKTTVSSFPVSSCQPAGSVHTNHTALAQTLSDMHSPNLDSFLWKHILSAYQASTMQQNYRLAYLNHIFSQKFVSNSSMEFCTSQSVEQLHSSTVHILQSATTFFISVEISIDHEWLHSTAQLPLNHEDFLDCIQIMEFEYNRCSNRTLTAGSSTGTTYSL